MLKLYSLINSLIPKDTKLSRFTRPSDFEKHRLSKQELGKGPTRFPLFPSKGFEIYSGYPLIAVAVEKLQISISADIPNKVSGSGRGCPLSDIFPENKPPYKVVWKVFGYGSVLVPRQETLSHAEKLF